MRKGEIWDVAVGTGGRTRRVMIVSAGEWHASAPVQVVVISRRHGMEEILPFTVGLHEQADSVGGIAYMTTLTPIDPGDLIEAVGSVSGPTLSKVDYCLRKVFAL